MKEIDKNEFISLSINDLANYFSAYQTTDNRLIFNLNNTIHIINKEHMSPTYYKFYTVTEKDTWPLISYKLYNTYELWWLVCKTNDIVQPMKEEPLVGSAIKYLVPPIVEQIINRLKT